MDRTNNNELTELNEMKPGSDQDVECSDDSDYEDIVGPPSNVDENEDKIVTKKHAKRLKAKRVKGSEASGSEGEKEKFVNAGETGNRISTEVQSTSTKVGTFYKVFLLSMYSKNRNTLQCVPRKCTFVNKQTDRQMYL